MYCTSTCSISVRIARICRNRIQHVQIAILCRSSDVFKNGHLFKKWEIYWLLIILNNTHARFKKYFCRENINEKFFFIFIELKKKHWNLFFKTNKRLARHRVLQYFVYVLYVFLNCTLYVSTSFEATGCGFSFVQ